MLLQNAHSQVCIKFVRTCTAQWWKTVLHGIAVLNIENELAKNIDYDKVVDIFKTVPSLRDAALAAGDSTELSARRLKL